MECSKFGKSFIILIILAFTAAIGVILLFIGCAMGFERAIAGEHTYDIINISSSLFVDFFLT
jgi:hypothetical protein